MLFLHRNRHSKKKKKTLLINPIFNMILLAIVILARKAMFLNTVIPIPSREQKYTGLVVLPVNDAAILANVPNIPEAEQ